MISKHRKLFISLGIVIGILLAIIVFCLTLFTVKDVKFDYRTELVMAAGENYDEEEIIKKSGIKYGKCVFFLKKNKFKDNIEKNFPYLKVINIETSFPSHLTIHVAERQEFYVIDHAGQLLFCDDEFKVLRIVDDNNGDESYTSTNSNAIYIPKDSIRILSNEIGEGEFLDVQQEGVVDLYNAMLVNSRGRAEMLNLCKQIEVTFHGEREIVSNGEVIEKDIQTDIKVTTFSGRKIYIENIGYGLKYKLQKLFAIMSSIMEIDKFYLDGQEYNRDKVADQTEIDNILSSAQIHIKNYASEYQIDDNDNIKKVYSEKDCYYELTYGGKTLRNELN